MIDHDDAPTDMRWAEDVLTIEQAAEYLKIGRTKMYELVATGAVRSVTIGRLRRVPVECLREYVAALLHQGAPAGQVA